MPHHHKLPLGTMVATALLALLQLAAAGASQWRLCDSAAKDPVQATQVVLTPDPPVIGSPATFTVTGTSGITASAGTVEIIVTFAGMEIFSQSENICLKTSCPIKPGPVTVTLVEDLPPIAPPGVYGLQVIAKDADGVQLMCLNVDFELVPPSLAEQASAASMKTIATTRAKLALPRAMVTN